MPPGRPNKFAESADHPFGKALKQLLSSKNLTQKTLAERSNVSPETISRMIKGERLRGSAARDNLRRILKALYEEGLITSLEDANGLLTTIPGIAELDERDDEDNTIIKLFQMKENTAPPITGVEEQRPSTMSKDIDGKNSKPTPPSSLPMPEQFATRATRYPPTNSKYRLSLWATISTLTIVFLLIGAAAYYLLVLKPSSSTVTPCPTLKSLSTNMPEEKPLYSSKLNIPPEELYFTLYKYGVSCRTVRRMMLYVFGVITFFTPIFPAKQKEIHAGDEKEAFPTRICPSNTGR